MTTTDFRAGFLRGTSLSTKAEGDFWSGQYDLLVVASSWDSRCTAITKCRDLRADFAVLLLYDAKDDQGLRNRHDRELGKYLNRIARDLTVVRGQATDVHATWRALVESMISAAKSRARPLVVGCDITTMPRYASCGLLATAFRLGLVRGFDVFYTEGFYPAVASGDVVFKSGRWETIDIPFLGGEAEAGESTLLVTSLGFEGDQTFRVVSRLDPERLAVLIPDPGVAENYPAKTLRQNQGLLSAYAVGRKMRMRAHAADAVAAWKVLSQASALRSARMNTLYLPAGTKAHAIGMALHCLENSKPTLLYNRPREYKVVDVTPTGIHWTYRLLDLSLPPTAELG